MRIVVLLATVLSVSTAATAERFLGMQPGDKLIDVVALYPNAKFEELKPVWLQSNQRLVQFSGPGVDGIVAVKLEHEVDSLSIQLRTLAIKQANRGSISSIEDWVLRTYPDRLAALRENPPKDPWEVKDIRWEPPSPLSLKSVLTKYGPIEKDEIDEQFRRTVQWEMRGIMAYVNSSEAVTLLIFKFTIGDIICNTSWRKGEACDPLDPGGLKPRPNSQQRKQVPNTKRQSTEGLKR